MLPTGNGGYLSAMSEKIFHSNGLQVNRYCGEAWIGKDRRCYSFYQMSSVHFTREALRELVDVLKKELDAQ